MYNARERRTVNNELKGKRYDDLKSAGEKDYLKESNGTVTVTQTSRKSKVTHLQDVASRLRMALIR